MKSAIAAIAILLGAGLLSTPAGAADVQPFPTSRRAAAIRADDACWRDCQAACTAALGACLRRDGQGRCLSHTDHCDRVCQRQCRTRGGPLVPDIFDF